MKTIEQRFRYKVHLLNVSSFMDIGHFLTLFKAKLDGADMTAYPIDTPGPQSEHSQQWELQFGTSDCPAGLNQVHRISGSRPPPILVHHITTHKQPHT